MQQAGEKEPTRLEMIRQADTFFLPSFCSIRALFVVVFSTELLAVILTLASVDELTEFLEQLSLISLLAQWIALSTVALLCLLRGRLQRLGNRWAALLAWGVLLLSTLVISGGVVWLNDQEGLPLVVGQASHLLVKATIISGIVGLVILHYLYLLYRWKQQKVAESAARFQALNSRIRPHFLFNSMNTIASLTRSDPAKAEEVVENLADLFRVSLGDANRQSTLGRELELARQYLSIENLRLGDRLRVEWELDSIPESVLLPPLTLQPLLENAVYHGIEPAAEGGRIYISGRYRKHRVNLSIRNTLPEVPRETHRKGNRLAVENIRQRLAGLYDQTARLTESYIDGEHQVRIVIPHLRSSV